MQSIILKIKDDLQFVAAVIFRGKPFMKIDIMLNEEKLMVIRNKK